MVLASLLVGALAMPLRAAPLHESPRADAFKAEILPIFEKHCLRCHDAKVHKGGLDLSTSEGAAAGGDSGPAVEPRRPTASRLFEMIENGEMPLDRKSQVSAAEVQSIRAWIEGLDLRENSGGQSAQWNQHDIIPILLRHCTTCHNHRRHEGELDLTTRESMLCGGKSGPALVPGEPDKSPILLRILAKEMPPLGVFDALVTRPPESDIEKLKQWISQGAPEKDILPDVATTKSDSLVSDHDRQFWSFRHPRSVAVPVVPHADRVRNAIDSFILEKLEAKGLTLSPEADRLTFIRRACLDLTGLPPTPDEARAFAIDADPQACENLIDRLLASPRYGERWGRYWLDLAGYADTESRDADRDHAWLYRDYVIRAFNSDKPYDRFLLEQIAGDELAEHQGVQASTQELMDNLVATGFLRLTPDPTSQGESGLIADRISVVSDEMQVFSSAILGLTIQCAQCHDHKLEPIPQRDYYRLRAVFKGALDEYDWLVPNEGVKNQSPRVLTYVAPPVEAAAATEHQRSSQATNSALSAEIGRLNSALVEKAKPLEKEIVETNLARQPAELRDELRLMLATAPEKRDARQKELADKYEFYVGIPSSASTPRPCAIQSCSSQGVSMKVRSAHPSGCMCAMTAWS